MIKNMMEAAFRWNPWIVKGTDDNLQLKRELTEGDYIDKATEKMIAQGFNVTKNDVARFRRIMDDIIFEDLEEGKVVEYWPGEIYILPSTTPDGLYEIYSPDPQLQEIFEKSILRMKFKVRH